MLSKMLNRIKIKGGESVDFNKFSAFVTPTGFKPVTAGAEIQNSIQLNYGALKDWDKGTAIFIDFK